MTECSKVYRQFQPLIYATFQSYFNQKIAYKDYKNNGNFIRGKTPTP